MRFVALRDLKINPSRILQRLLREDLVVTRKGKPAAALIYLNEDLLDQFVLLHHPSLMKEVRAARTEYFRKGGVGHAEMKKRIERRRGG